MEVPLRSKELLSKLQTKYCVIETKEKVMEIMIAALVDTLCRVCSAQADDPLQMLQLYDERYASRRASNRIWILASMYTKKVRWKSPYDALRGRIHNTVRLAGINGHGG